MNEATVYAHCRIVKYRSFVIVDTTRKFHILYILSSMLFTDNIYLDHRMGEVKVTVLLHAFANTSVFYLKTNILPLR